MKFRFFSPALFALTFISLNLNAQGPGIVIDSATGQNGQVVCVPVRAKGFVEVISMQGSISWDPQVLNYPITQNYSLPDLTTAAFNHNPQGNYLLFSWFDPSASCVSMDDDDILWEICFNVIGPAGSSSDIKIDTAIIEVCPTGQNIWSSSESPPGYIEVVMATNTSNPTLSKQLTINLTPNPTGNGAQVIVLSPKESEAKLFVTNPLGQTVFEQKISFNIGENQIQIPAEALTTKGAYQVTLQTEQGAASQILIVR